MKIPFLRRFLYWRALLYLNARWLFKSTQKPHALGHPLIVSLTSYPPRFKTLSRTLKCLLTQSIKPDRVILWIAHEDEAHLTACITSFKKYGLEIILCENLRSYKKIIPLLSDCAPAYVATADDDAYYHSSWLAELVADQRTEKKVSCHRAHKIVLDESGNPLPYAEWDYETISRDQSALIFPTGLGGVLYPPGCFHLDLLRADIFSSVCPSADDVWLYWMFRRNGYKAQVVNGRRFVVTWPETHYDGLWKENVQMSANDRQVKAMIQLFGFSAV